MEMVESTEIFEEVIEDTGSVEMDEISETEEESVLLESTESASTQEIMYESGTETVAYTTVSLDMTDVNNRLDGIYSCLIVIITLLGVLGGIVLGGVLWKRLR